METTNLKLFEVVWAYDKDLYELEMDEVYAETQEEAEERVERLYGTYENNYEDVFVHYSGEISDD